MSDEKFWKRKADENDRKRWRIVPGAAEPGETWQEYAAALEAEVARLRECLEKIAGESKVYRGHGDYDIVPAFDGEEAQHIARDALTLTPREV